jgi:hypothetical protein
MTDVGSGLLEKSSVVSGDVVGCIDYTNRGRLELVA